MPPGLQATLILALAAGLALMSAVAGALWWRARSLPLVEAVRMARALASRRRSLEALLDRLEAAGARATGGEASPIPDEPGPGAPPRASDTGGPPVPQFGGPAPPEVGANRPRVLGPRSGGPAPATWMPAPKLIAIPDLAARPAPAEADTLAGRFGAIWELADAGEPAEAIARRVNRPVGHVELILGLRRSMGGAGRRPDRGGPP